VSTPKSDDASSLNLPFVGDHESLRQRVTHALRGALITGEMRPGVLYSAPSLADKFGVSATPVRESMLDLAKEGLVKAVRNKGFRVTELSDRDLDEITAVRLLLEVPTIADIARHVDETIAARVEALRPMARDIVDLANVGDLIAYVGTDLQFHAMMLALWGNHHLVEVVGDLRFRSRLYGLRELADHGQLGVSAGEHEELIDLVLAGRADKVASLMRGHIGHVRTIWAGRPDTKTPRRSGSG